MMPPPLSPSVLSNPPTSSPCQQCSDTEILRSRRIAFSVSTPSSAYRSRASLYACSICREFIVGFLTSPVDRSVFRYNRQGRLVGQRGEGGVRLGLRPQRHRDRKRTR